MSYKVMKIVSHFQFFNSLQSHFKALNTKLNIIRSNSLLVQNNLIQFFLPGSTLSIYELTQRTSTRTRTRPMTVMHVTIWNLQEELWFRQELLSGGSAAGNSRKHQETCSQTSLCWDLIFFKIRGSWDLKSFICGLKNFKFSP